ncbi:hypothetical protein H2248_008118 [Termitomyces sp. 'cryptogamus']|nr:hypothetical protein H2248_008118 [Termitomyces sp. 'cryptogamus']
MQCHASEISGNYDMRLAHHISQELSLLVVDSESDDDSSSPELPKDEDGGDSKSDSDSESGSELDNGSDMSPFGSFSSRLKAWPNALLPVISAIGRVSLLDGGVPLL